MTDNAWSKFLREYSLSGDADGEAAALQWLEDHVFDNMPHLLPALRASAFRFKKSSSTNVWYVRAIYRALCVEEGCEHELPPQLSAGEPCPRCNTALAAFSPSGNGVAACDNCQTYWE